MHVAVLGAGVVGITTAYYLLKNGHDVTVVDQAADVAMECSYANGAQLSYSYVDAMANPAFLARIPGILCGMDRGIRVRPSTAVRMLRWGAEFLAQCSKKSSTGNTLSNLQLAVRSRQLLGELRQTLPGDFDHRAAGKLVLLSSRRDLDNASRASDFKAGLGCQADVISMDEAINIEPAIAQMVGNYVGAVWSPGDEVGDAHRFCSALAAHMKNMPGCRMLFETTIDGLVTDNRKLQAIATNRGLIDVDASVICLGSHSPEILKPLAVNLPIIPVRGYSITLPPGPHAAAVSITDFSSRFVISRIGEQMRIAGFADFMGFDSSRDAQRVAALIEQARITAPAVAAFDAPKNAWGGFRPLTPNGRPIIGATRIAGVYLNTGHGSSGWTLACASAEKLAQQLSSGDVTALAA